MANPQTQNQNRGTNPPRNTSEDRGDRRDNNRSNNGPDRSQDRSTQQDRPEKEGAIGIDDTTARSGKTSGPQQRKDRDPQDASSGRKLNTEDKLGQDETNMGADDVQDGSPTAQGRADSGQYRNKHNNDNFDKTGDAKSANAGKTDKGGCGCG